MMLQLFETVCRFSSQLIMLAGELFLPLFTSLGNTNQSLVFPGFETSIPEISASAQIHLRLVVGLYCSNSENYISKKVQNYLCF